MNKRKEFGDRKLSGLSSMSDLSESSSTSNNSEDLTFCSSSSSDLIEDDASSSFDSSYRPLHDFSVLVATLPIKRGLSQFFHGKSQSFASIFEANCIQDLSKKENPYSKRMKYSSRSEELKPIKPGFDVFF